MPHQHRILPDLDLAYLQYSGYVTRDDQRSLLAEVTADPLHRFDMPKLLHSRNVTGTDLDLTAFMWMRDRITPAYAGFDRTVPWAAIGASDLEFGMARVLQSVIAGMDAIQMEVFRDPVDALRFLNLSDTDAARRLELG